MDEPLGLRQPWRWKTTPIATLLVDTVRPRERDVSINIVDGSIRSGMGAHHGVLAQTESGDRRPCPVWERKCEGWVAHSSVAPTAAAGS